MIVNCLAQRNTKPLTLHFIFLEFPSNNHTFEELSTTERPCNKASIQTVPKTACAVQQSTNNSTVVSVKKITTEGK